MAVFSTVVAYSAAVICCRKPAVETYQLYQFDSCPFCFRVRQFLQESGFEAAGIEVTLRDTVRDPEARRELLEGGGMGMVPCLRIEREGVVRWLYESMDIIDYLRQRLQERTA
ncbi:MAG: glutathione S-transferase N-terminal domain-containing protein [Pseudomonadales bacterium]